MKKNWKIRTISIRGFRGITGGTDRMSAGAAVFLGRNGAGKTRILQAIRMALQGDCHGIDGKRIRTSGLVAAGDAAQIIMDIDDGGIDKESNVTPLHLIATITDGKFAFDFKRTHARAYNFKGKDIRAAFLQDHDTTEEALNISLDPYRYLVDPVALGEVLAGLADDTGDMATALAEFCAKRKKAFEKYTAMIDVDTLSDLDILGQTFYDERTVLKRERGKLVSTIETKFKFLIAPVDRKRNPLTPDQIDDVSAAIVQMQAEIETNATKIGQLQSEGQVVDVPALKNKVLALESPLGRAEKELSNSQKRLATARKELEKLEANKTKKPVGLLSTEEDRNLAASISAELETTRAKLQTTLNALNDSGDRCCPCGGTCPKCDGFIDGELSQEQIDNMNGDAVRFDEEIKNMSEAQNTILQRIAAAQEQEDNEDKVGSKLADAYGKVSTIEIEVGRNEGDVAAKRDEIDRVNAEIEEAGTVEAQDHSAAIAELQTKQDGLRGRMNNGIETKQTLIQMRERDGMNAELAEIDRQLEFIQWGVESFHSAAFQKSQMGDGRDKFEEKCNSVLGRFGYLLRVNIEGAKPIIVMAKIEPKSLAHPTDYSWFPIMECSNGERVMAAMAIGAAFANGGPVIIDNINDLDGVHKNSALMTAQALLDQCTFILGATWSDGAKPSDAKWAALTSAITPVLPVWVEDGGF